MAYFISNKSGQWGEDLALSQYSKKGYILVARNVYNKKGKMLGELDLVMRSETHLIFIEVKTRTSDKFGSVVESISAHKKRKILNSVNWFRRRFPQYEHLQPRIDVCAITIDNLDKTSVNVIIIPSAIEVNC